MKLTDNIYLVGGGEPDLIFTDQMDCNIYLIRSEEFYILVDAGGGQAVDKIIENIRGHGIDLKEVEWLLLTHAHGDHAAGSGLLKEWLPNLKVAISYEVSEWLRSGDEKAISLDKGRASGMYPDEFKFLPCPVDLEVRDGQKLKLSNLTFEILSTPGHCKGHISYLVHDQGKSILFAGDAIFPEGKILLQDIWDCDLHQSMRSVERLAALKADHLFAGHRQPILDEAASHFKIATDRIASVVAPWNLF
tara:strand:- start:242 stop:985 length:744 start_codon:yes stop_codon:yes gene_type:complete